MLTASSGEEGLQILEREPVELVVSDHRMAALSGIEFLRQVRERWPQTLRILLTGYADLQMAIDAINKGELYRFLTKPWEDAELRQSIRLGFERMELGRENSRPARHGALAGQGAPQARGGVPRHRRRPARRRRRGFGG